MAVPSNLSKGDLREIHRRVATEMRRIPPYLWRNPKALFLNLRSRSSEHPFYMTAMPDGSVKVGTVVTNWFGKDDYFLTGHSYELRQSSNGWQVTAIGDWIE